MKNNLTQKHSHRVSTIANLALVLGVINPTIRSAESAIVVDLTAEAIGGDIFTYSVDITNSGFEDFAVVSITDAPFNDPLITSTISAPIEFLGVYTEPLGFIDFLEFTGNFAAGTTVGGFTFDSHGAPDVFFQSFEALSVSGAFESGAINQTINGGPGAAAPDSSDTLALTALGMLFLVGATRRNRQLPTS